MHYKDGTEVKLGDRCRFPCHEYPAGAPARQVMREGLVFMLHPGSTTCNMQVAYPFLQKHVAPDGSSAACYTVLLAESYVTAGQCERSG